MNRALPEMLHGLNSPGNVAGGTDTSILERQRAQTKWQFQQQKDFYGSSISPRFHRFAGDQMGPDRVVKPDPGKFGGDDYLEFGAYGYENVPGLELNCANSNSTFLPPPPAAAEDCTGGRDPVLPGKKRKGDKMLSLKVIEEDSEEKRIKEWAEEGDSKITEQNNININKNDNKKDNSTNNSKEYSKITDVQKTDYIHVRARRGQATDSHSLAERVRREKISERMKYLQDLVPGCDKITGKAGMLDEIINYVQSLQRQVEFLSMKLATVTPSPAVDFNVDNFITKEMFLASSSNFADNSLSSDMIIPAAYQLNQLQQLVSSVTAPLSNLDTFLDSFCFNQIQPPLNFGAELQNFYGAEFQQGRTIAYPLQTFTGSMEGGNLKMET